MKNITITSTISNYAASGPVPTTSKTFELNILNPCDTAIITAVSYPHLTTTVLVSATTTTPIWYDSYSGSAAVKKCGPFTVTVTKTTKPTLYLEATMS